MENDTNYENIDSTNDTEIVETDSTGTETEGTDTPSEPEVDVAKLHETNKRLFERAKKAEQELKALKGTKAPAETTRTVQQTSPADIQETVLKMNGMSDELLNKLKKIAAINGTDLATAQTDELFVAAKEKFEKESKLQKASLGASRGSGQVKPKVSADTPGISREEHMRLAKEAIQR